jgi:hypothetical protein
VVDAVLSGALGVCVCADEVARFSKYVAVLGSACVYSFLGDDFKEDRASVYPWGVERDGSYYNALCLTERKGGVGARERLVMRVEFAVVGDGAGFGRSAGCKREEMSCRWTVLE